MKKDFFITLGFTVYILKNPMVGAIGLFYFVQAMEK